MPLWSMSKRQGLEAVTSWRATLASQTRSDKICAWGLADIGMHPARGVLKQVRGKTGVQDICTRAVGGEVVLVVDRVKARVEGETG